MIGNSRKISLLEIFQNSHKQGTFRKPIFKKNVRLVRVPKKEEFQAMQSRHAIPKQFPTPSKNKEIKAEGVKKKGI